MTDRALRAEASAWIAKLHGPERSADLEEDFRAWLKNPAHAEAFEHVTEIWDDLANVNVGGLPRLAADYPLERRESRRQTRRMFLAAAATLAIALVGLGGWLYLTRGLYTTGVGEQRIVSLDDGSRIYLNSDSRLDVDFQDRSRRIELERGEAYFEVAKDSARPFTVTAGNRTVTALGTMFVVRYEPTRTAITLVEGKISVAPTVSEVAPPPVRRETTGVVTLDPGQRITFEQSGAAAIDVPRRESTAAWRRGEVVLDETPLGSAIEEMNRYQRQHLTLDDAGLDSLPISGIYRSGNNLDFAHAIAAVYDLEVIASDGEIHLRRKSAK